MVKGGAPNSRARHSHHAPTPQQLPKVWGSARAQRSTPTPSRGSPKLQPQEVQLQTRPRRDGPASLRQHEPSTLASVLASLTYVLLCAKCKHFINREAERQKTTRLARHCTQRSQALPLRPGAGTLQVFSPAPCPAQTCPGAGAGGIGFWQRVGEGCLTPRPPFTCGSLAQTVATVSSSADASQGNRRGLC